MKNKLSIQNFKLSFFSAWYAVLANSALTYVVSVLCWYWILPHLCTLIPPLAATLEQIDQTNPSAAIAASRIVSVACGTLCYPFATAIAYRFSPTRKRAFLAEYANRKMSYTDGVKLYLRSHGLADMIVFALLLLGLTAIYASTRGTIFSLIFLTFYGTAAEFGVGTALLISLMMSAFSIPCGAFLAQKKWCAEYHLGK